MTSQSVLQIPPSPGTISPVPPPGMPGSWYGPPGSSRYPTYRRRYAARRPSYPRGRTLGMTRRRTGYSIPRPVRVMTQRSSTAPRPNSLTVHRWKRGTSNTNITTWSTVFESGALWSAGSQVFDLGKVTNFSDLTNAYDEYRIDGVKVSFIITPYVDVAAGVGLTIGGYELWVFQDSTDATAPVGPAEFQERADVKRLQFDSDGKVSWFCRPRVVQALLDATLAATTYAAVEKPQWLSCDVATVPHFSMKWGIRTPAQAGITSGGSISIQSTYYITMRNPR